MNIMKEMLVARDAIVNKMVYDGHITVEEYFDVYEDLRFLNGVQITEKQLDLFFAGEYSYENNFMPSTLSDAWDIVDDIISNGI